MKSMDQETSGKRKEDSGEAVRSCLSLNLNPVDSTP